MLAFPKLIQLSQMECGPTALRIVAKYYGKHISSIKAQELCILSREGSSLLNLSNAAENIGFRTRAVKLNLEKPYITICRNCYISICRFWYIVIFRLQCGLHPTPFFLDQNQWSAPIVCFGHNSF